MNEAMVKAMLARIQALEDAAVDIRRGEVTDDSPLAVALGGSDIPHPDCKHEAAYTPVIGDQVMVLVWGNDIFVLDKIA
jgi:hypothetical protein